MIVRVHLRDSHTGVSLWRDYDSNRYDDEHGAWFEWTQNNLACDCVRRSIFTDDWETEFPCGEGGIELLSLEIDGKHITSDLEETFA